MFKDFISDDIAVQIYPIISLVVFVLFFVALSLRAVMYSKKELQEMSSIPLDPQYTQINEPVNSQK